MTTLRTMRWLALAATMLVTACGGSPTATIAPGATQAPGQPTAAPGTQPPAPTQAGGGGDTYSGKVCDLISAAEIESILGIPGATGTETPISNGSGACYWLDANGDPVVAISVLVDVSSSAVWEVYRTQPDTVLIPGVGEGAGFIPSAQTVFVTKNGVLVGIQAGGPGSTAEVRQDKGTEFARAIAARL
jgi:hypothetical protein